MTHFFYKDEKARGMVIFNERKRRYAKALVLTVFLGSVAFFLYMQYYFATTCPRSSDVSSGHVYPLLLHGGSVYLTLGQHRATQLMDVMWVVIVVSCGFTLKYLTTKENSKK
jgi:hypothetical protein